MATRKSVAIDLSAATQSGAVRENIIDSKDSDDKSSKQRQKLSGGGIGATTLLPLLRSLANSARKALADARLRNIALFGFAYSVVSVLTFMYGMYCDSLALMADACHMLLACANLSIRLATFTVADSAANATSYSYGAQRIEVILSFCAAASAVFVSLFLLFESAEHFLLMPPVQGANLVTVATFGLVVKMAAALFFSDAIRVRNEMAQAIEQPADRWRHTIVDVICSLGVIFNGWLISAHKGMLGDAVIAFLIAILLIGAAVPICYATGLVLLHTTPVAHRDSLTAATRDALLLNGVVDCRAPHFWTLAPGVVAGSIVVIVRRDVDRVQLLNRIRQLFSPFVQHLTVEVESEASLTEVDLHAHEHSDACSHGHHH